VYIKTVYYLPPLITRGSPIDTLRWSTMSGADKAAACSTKVGWELSPGGSCSSSNQLFESALAETSLVVQCAKGFSVALNKANKCSKCADGYYAPGLDLPSCTLCEPGRFSNPGTGHEECKRCPAASFAELYGSTECTSCPANIDDPLGKSAITNGAGKASRFDCICERKDTKINNPNDLGYYGPPGGPCRACPNEGARCMDDNMTWPVNTEGWYLELDFGPHIAIPLPCNFKQACPAHENWEDMRWQPCAKGYNSTRCAECWMECNENVADNGFNCFDESSEGYEWWNPKRSQWFRYTKQCRECPRIVFLPTLLGLMFGIGLMVPLIFKLSENSKFASAINITLTFCQILAVFARFNIVWPTTMTWMWENLSLLNLNFQLLAPECVLNWKWIHTYLITVSAPVALFFVLLLVVCARLAHRALARTLGEHLKKSRPARECLSQNPMCNYHSLCDECKLRPKQQRPNPGITGPPIGKGFQFWVSKQRYRLGMFITRPSKKDKYWDLIKVEVRVFLNFLRIGYIFLAMATLGYFDCAGRGSAGVRYLTSDPTLECYNWSLADDQDKTWPRLFPLAVAAALIYPVGILVLFSLILMRVRKSLDTRAAKSLAGNLYIRYKPSAYFWEVIITLRKLAIVVAVVLFSAETAANGLRQLLFGKMVLLGALLSHMYTYPFDRKNLNHLESAAIAALFFSLFVGLAFLSDKMSKGFMTFMEICSLVVMALTFAACAYMILADLFPDMRARYNEFSEKRQEARLRKQRLQDRDQKTLSILGYKKVMEFRWRAALGATASKLLTATGARILSEFISSDKTLDSIINEGRAAEKHIELPTDEHGRPLTKKEAVRKCFENLSDFIHDDEVAQQQERRYVYEYFRPNVRNVLLEGLSREDKETTDRLKAFLEKVVHSEEASNKPKTGFNHFRRMESGKKNIIHGADDDDSDGEEQSSRVMPADAKPLLFQVKSQAT